MITVFLFVWFAVFFLLSLGYMSCLFWLVLEVVVTLVVAVVMDLFIRSPSLGSIPNVIVSVNESERRGRHGTPVIFSRANLSNRQKGKSERKRERYQTLRECCLNKSIRQLSHIFLYFVKKKRKRRLMHSHWTLGFITNRFSPRRKKTVFRLFRI